VKGVPSKHWRKRRLEATKCHPGKTLRKSAGGAEKKGESIVWSPGGGRVQVHPQETPSQRLDR